MRDTRFLSLVDMSKIDVPMGFIPMLVLSMCLLISSCLSSQTVTRPLDNSLVLRQTTIQEILKRHGNPSQYSESIRNFEPIATYLYAETSRTAKPLHEHVQSIKTLAMNFHKDILVSYNFLANHANDHTDFDESKVELMQKGKHTKADVRNLLGTPAGKGVWPIIADENALMWVYRYAHASYKNGNPPQIYDKELAITFNEKGIVSDLKYTVKGKLD